MISGAVTRGKLETGAIQKVAGPEAQLKDLVSNDNGKASLVDTQFFLFSMLALVGVAFAFIQSTSKIPEIPTGLAMLTSVAALIYTGQKALDRNASTIFSVARASGKGEIKGRGYVAYTGGQLRPSRSGR